MRPQVMTVITVLKGRLKTTQGMAGMGSDLGTYYTQHSRQDSRCQNVEIPSGSGCLTQEYSCGQFLMGSQRKAWPMLA